MTQSPWMTVLNGILTLAFLVSAVQAWTRQHDLLEVVLWIGMTGITASRLGTGVPWQVIGVVGTVLIFASLGIRVVRWYIRNAR